MYSYLSPVFLSSHYHDCSTLSLGNYCLQHTLTNTWGRSQSDCQTLLHNNSTVEALICMLNPRRISKLCQLRNWNVNWTLSSTEYHKLLAQNIYAWIGHSILKQQLPSHSNFCKENYHYTFAIQSLSCFETIHSYYHNWVIIIVITCMGYV
jgi:hypothetical protein